MTPPRLDTILHGPPGLIVHVGAGADGPGALARSARTAILIEPDPQLAARLRGACASLPSVRLIEAAVARETGMGCITASDVLTEDDFAGGGETVLLIDATDDSLEALDAMDAAGWLERFDHVIVAVREAARDAGSTARTDIEAWARAQGRLMLALPGQSDPDLWRAWISPANRAAHARGSTDGVPAPAARADELEAALATYRAAARDAEARWLEQRSALLRELRASQMRCGELEAGGELDAVRREAAEAEARNRKLREELQAELEASKARGLELARAREQAETARAKAEKELQSARKDAGDTGREQAAHRDETARLQERVRAGAERERALSAQIKAAREDLRLAITGQRLAQASLSELQARYGALLDDRNELDGLLRQLTDRLTSAANARLGADRKGAQTDWDH
ncbi:MAG: hypothetical protein LAT81_07420 [Oceanicaulis sp.]|nr:hypothetical protein [Oceanicaulis sp.]